jgi:MFS family permease
MNTVWPWYKKNLFLFLHSGWMLWFFASLFYFLQYMVRSAPNILAETFMAHYNIQAIGLGALSSTYYNTYAFSQIPFGILLDASGLRTVLLGTILLFILGIYGLANTNSIPAALFCRSLIGLGTGACFIGTIQIISTTCPSHWRMRLIGLTIFLGKLSGVFTSSSLSPLIHFNWQTIFLYIGHLSFFIWIYFLFFLPKKKFESFFQKTLLQKPQKEMLKFKTSSSQIFHESFKKLRIIFGIPIIWMIGIYGALLYLPVSVLSDLWGASFLSTIPNISFNQAASLSTWILWGSCIGSPLFSLLPQKKIPHTLLFGAILSTFLLIWCILYTPHNMCYLAMLLFAIGFTSSTQSLIFGYALMVMEQKSHSQEIFIESGLISSVVNTLVMLGGVVFQPLIGFFLHIQQYHAEKYNLKIFQYALSALPLAAFIAIFIAFFSFLKFPLYKK